MLYIWSHPFYLPWTSYTEKGDKNGDNTDEIHLLRIPSVFVITENCSMRAVRSREVRRLCYCYSNVGRVYIDEKNSNIGKFIRIPNMLCNQTTFLFYEDNFMTKAT